jgi:hypothetical protein
MDSKTIDFAECLKESADVPAPPTKADILAQSNWNANLSALKSSQPDVVSRIKLDVPDEWTFGRDGFLTARSDDGFWWRGCSVPLLAGRQALKSLKLTGPVGCFIWPHHAGHLRACFEVIEPNQAIIAVIPDALTLTVILHCDQFATEIAAGRLHFAVGWDWEKQLSEIFQKNPGLPLPQQFIRTPLLPDDEMQPFVNLGQTVIGNEMGRRSELIAQVIARSDAKKRTETLVVAGSNFDLSNLAPTALAETFSKCKRLNIDQPLHASPLALAMAAESAGSLIAADMFRHDLPGIVSNRTKWITWITRGRIAPPLLYAPRDRILLADPNWKSIAEQAGWPSDRIDIAAWPEGFLPFTPRQPRADLIALPVDTVPLDPPTRVKEFSSHVLLWERIAQELSNNPLSIGVDPMRCLDDHRRQMGITEQGFDAITFLERLILPAYHQGLARQMLREKIPLVLFGRGWMDIEEFRPHAAGPMRSPRDLSTALATCAAVIHPIPNDAAHPAESFGLPIIRPTLSGLRQTKTPQRSIHQLDDGAVAG